ncbi:MAG: rod shape-determining protein RodA [Nitrospirae bacterium]|nr:rod shape-determining protein RodA [Nitrospirota bacterium]
MKVTIPIRKLREIDRILVVVPVIITIIGILTIYSGTRPALEQYHPPFYIRQLIWLLISLVAMAMMFVFDYRWLQRLAYPLYAVGLFLLLLTIFAGYTGMGAQRWLRIGPLSFQPSEVFRIILIIATAKYLQSKRAPIDGITLAMSLVLFGIIPFSLLYKQPDLGTALMLFLITSIMVLTYGVRKRILVTLIALFLLLSPVVGQLLWKGLKPYQKNRLIAFIKPEVDPYGIGYQIEQSKITIGSGKLLGKGYLKGTQGPLRFLPEKHTDFVFSVFSEEWGFIGSLVILGLYLLLIVRGFETAYIAKDPFSTLVSTGISSMLLLYVTINIGMTMGLMPVVGVPLPFFSYGGTALLSNFMAVGLLINIRMRRYKLFY